MVLQPGDKVKRLEDRPQALADVVAVVAAAGEEVAFLAYEEGGEGWWPASCLELQPGP